MSLSNGFRRIADLIDEIEADDVAVTDAAIPREQEAFRDGKVEITLDVTVALDEEAVIESHSSTTEQEPERTTVSGTLDDQQPNGDRDEPENHTSESRTNGQKEATTADQVPEADGEDDIGKASETANQSSTEPVESQADAAADDSIVTCPEPGCDKTFESEPGMKIHRTKIHRRGQETQTADDGPPAYRDPEALQAAYDAHDSFPAMREALDVDVSAQTVRRHMIQHGIHEPTSSGSDTGSETTDQQGDADDETTDRTVEEAVDGNSPNESETDGSNVSVQTEADDTASSEGDDPEQAQETPETEPEAEPDEAESEDEEPSIPETTPLSESLPPEVTAPSDVTFAELREAVRTADTLYDVHQQFDVDRDQARDLLDHLDLLELVYGRVATKHEREELKAEIDSRIRHSIDTNGTSA